MKALYLTLLFPILFTSFCLGQQSDSLKGVSYLDKAKTAVLERKYDQALPYFDLALSSFTPKNYRAYGYTLLGKADAYSRLSKYDIAIDLFKQAGPFVKKTYQKDSLSRDLTDYYLQLGWHYETLGNYQQAISYYDSTEWLVLESNKKKHLLSYVASGKGRIYDGLGRQDLATAELEKTVKYAIESGHDRAIENAKTTMGDYYARLGLNEKARQEYFELLKHSENIYESDNPRLATTYERIARFEYSMQEYEKAMAWIQKAIAIHEKSPDDRGRRHASRLYTLATIEGALNEYDNALVHINEALIKYRANTEDSLSFLLAFTKKVDLLTELGRYQEALRIVNDFDLAIQSPDVKPLSKLNFLLKKADLLREMGNFTEAAQVNRKVISEFNKDFSNQRLALADAYLSFSQLWQKQNEFDSALYFIDQALAVNLIEYEVDGIVESSIVSGQNQTLFLREKAKIFTSKGGRQNFSKALEILEEGLAFIKDIKIASTGAQFTSKEVFNIRNQALPICYELYQETGEIKYLEKAFSYGEMAKSQQLYEWVHESAFDSIAEIRVGGLSKSEIENKLIIYENILTNLDKSDSLFTQKNEQFKDSLLFYKQKYFESIALIKQSNPDYYQILYNDMQPSIERTKNSLGKNELLISYLWSDTSLFVVKVGDHPDFKRLNTQKLGEKIDAFRKELSRSDGEFEVLAQELYQILIEPLNITKNKRLTIISDGSLAYLPFELLMENTHFLFEEHLIRYAYSANTLIPIKKNDVPNSLVAFAPTFNMQNDAKDGDVVRGELAKLPGALAEAKTVAEIFAGYSYLENEATETNFLETSGDQKLLHLATHAVVDDLNPEKSKLVFFDLENDTINDGYLHAYEIYNLNLNAHLVTLSACNTGFGKIRKGEGVMSLSRAFAYAGVPSTVVSLWPASDKSTPELMKYFYQNLKEGQSKDVALNNARKQYLATAQGKARHPFYWGGFVLIGDNSPIEDDTNLLVYVIPSVLIIVMIFTVYRRKKNPTNINQ